MILLAQKYAKQPRQSHHLILLAQKNAKQLRQSLAHVDPVDPIVPSDPNIQVVYIHQPTRSAEHKHKYMTTSFCCQHCHGGPVDKSSDFHTQFFLIPGSNPSCTLLCINVYNDVSVYNFDFICGEKCS